MSSDVPSPLSQSQLEDSPAYRGVAAVGPPCCESMKKDEPTIKKVIDEFFVECRNSSNKKKRVGVDTFNWVFIMLERYLFYASSWDCNCNLDGGQEELYCETHGISNINIATFCEDYIIRKEDCDLSERKKVANVMNKFTDFLYSKKYIDLKTKTYFKSSMKDSVAVDCNKVMAELRRLKEEKYWKKMVVGGEVPKKYEQHPIDSMFGIDTNALMNGPCGWMHTTKTVLRCNEVLVTKVTDRGWYLHPPSYERIDEDGNVESDLTEE